MEYKICTSCHKNKKIEEFSLRNTINNKRQSWCKKCSNSNRMIYYFNNLDKEKQWHKNRILRNKEFIKTYLMTHPCVDCNFSNYLALQFDHIKEKKIESIAVMVVNGLSLKTIKKEIEKCEVRCANCHQIKHKKIYLNGSSP